MTIQIAFPEWLSVAFFAFFAALSWRRPLDFVVRLKITALGAGGAALVFLALYAARIDPAFETARRVLPIVLIPMAYFQTGRFVSPLNQRLQDWLERIDRRTFHFLKAVNVPVRLKRWLRVYGECAYLFCYPMVPSGLALLYWAGFSQHAAEFWSIVLPPAYLSYATLPLARTLPPRALENPGFVPQERPTRIRRLNGFVLHHLSHHANTFPSGHAAASVAVALALIRHTPVIGSVYLVIATSIMAGAFAGRYHYLADVLLGAALAVMSFLLVQ